MKPASIVALLLLAGLGGCIYWGYKPFWQFDHLEQNARKVITGPELQTWATRLIDEYPTMQSNYVWISQLRTNYPQRLRGLAPQIGPFVYVKGDDDTNGPAFVSLRWGSALLGDTGFYVGRTNFVMDSGLYRGSMWQPGVYFFRR